MCSCGLAEHFPIHKGRVIVSEMFQARHEGHQLTAIGAALPERLLVKTTWDIPQKHFQPEAKGRGR